MGGGGAELLDGGVSRQSKGPPQEPSGKDPGCHHHGGDDGELYVLVGHGFDAAEDRFASMYTLYLTDQMVRIRDDAPCVAMR